METAGGFAPVRELPPDRPSEIDLVRAGERTSPGAYRAADQRALKGPLCLGARQWWSPQSSGKCSAGFQVKIDEAINNNWSICGQILIFSIENKIHREDFIMEPNGRAPRMGVISVPTDATKYSQVLE